MLTPLFSVFIGFVLGFLAGLGVGGGSLLILWLTLIVHTDSSTARAINLMFFISAATAVSVFRIRKGNLKIRKILPAIISGCLAALIFSRIGLYLDDSLLRKFFGGLLLATGLRELFYRPRKAK